jgi:tyrosyl-tRNA synthetase
MEKDIKKQLEIIKRGTSEIISEGELKEKLEHSIKTKTPLRIKAGFDPTAPDIHLGHTVLLRKLRHFQELGHKVIFLIGDATGLVGDPSGQSQMRKTLTWEEVEKNARTYEEQVGKILDTKEKSLFERRHNSEWFSKRGQKEKTVHPFAFEQFVELAQRYTVARLLERDDFQKRLKENKPISFLELFYPLMQGYDSVKLEADIEIGGTDQKFNLLVGRELQKEYGQVPQVVITMPLLVGLDGINKMSKSFGNCIGINEPPREIFGKVMSASDELMYKYYELLTDENMEEVKKLHPMEAKKNLAYLIAKNYHGEPQAKLEKRNFEEVFQKRKGPRDAPLKKLPPGVYTLNQVFDMAREEFRNMGVDSRSKLLNLLEQNAIEVGGKKIADANSAYFQAGSQHLLKVGKHKFLKIDTT